MRGTREYSREIVVYKPEEEVRERETRPLDGGGMPGFEGLRNKCDNG